MTEREKVDTTTPLGADEWFHIDGAGEGFVLVQDAGQAESSIENGYTVRRVVMRDSAALRAPASEGEAVRCEVCDNARCGGINRVVIGEGCAASVVAARAEDTHPAPATVTEADDLVPRVLAVLDATMSDHGDDTLLQEQDGHLCYSRTFYPDRLAYLSVADVRELCRRAALGGAR